VGQVSDLSCLSVILDLYSVKYLDPRVDLIDTEAETITCAYSFT
jgi:hypothetical protein